MKSIVRTPMMTLPVFLILQTAGLGQALAVPAGQKVVLTAEGRGSQIYKCDHAGAAIEWVFVAPEARLFADNAAIGSHGAGPMWTAMGGSVHGRVLESLDAPEALAVPWLLLKSTSSEGTGPMRSVSYISGPTQRVGSHLPTGATRITSPRPFEYRTRQLTPFTHRLTEQEIRFSHPS